MAHYQSTRTLALVAAVTRWAIVIAICSSGVVFGQGFFRPMQRTQSGRFIEAPRGVQQQLREAERALAEERYSDAVVRLGDLLQRSGDQLEDSDLAGQDFFFGIDEAQRNGRLVSDSLLRRARSMIGSLPAAAHETYELRYGPLARKKLQDAAADRDWEAVREVRRKFFHTKAGYDASLLLAQHELLYGHAIAASILLDEIVASDYAVAYLGPSVKLLHVSASKLAGRSIADLTWTGSGEIQVGGVSQSLPSKEQLSDWIDANYGLDDKGPSRDFGDYAMLGATPDRNGVSSGQMPLANARWKLVTTASPRQERSLRHVAESLAAGGKLPPPSWVPLRVGNQLLMRTTERLVGVDYRTGKRVWTYPWFSAYEAFEDESISFDVIPGDEGPGDLLSQRVWNDLPYGQMSSDGKRVFMIDDLGEVEMASFSSIIGLQGTRPADTGTNTLVALDLATEGKLLWRIGANEDAASSLSDAFFLGPPLPLDGRLYVLVEMAGDICLSCLDPATGDELWRQQLVAVETGGVDSDPIRRVAGAMPTFYEGLLICPTGAGAMVAMDFADRMLRWGVAYDRNEEMNRSINSRGTGLELSQLMQRWHTGSAVAAEDTLLVTPIESDRLYGFDLLTGETRFAEKPRVRMRYLAGIREGKFIVVGGSQVYAFDLRSGTQLWATDPDMLAAGQQIVGRGVFGDGDYFLPCTSNQLIRISLENGSVIERRTTRFPLGNLVAVGGEIIAQGATTLSVAFGEASLEPVVNNMLKKNPNDFEAIVRKSELLIQRGDREQALELLSRARLMEPDNDEVHMLSISAMLGMLRENPDVSGQFVETLDELIDQPSERVEFLALRIRAAISGGRRQEAAQRLAELSALLVREQMLEGAADQVVNDVSRQCSLDSWLAARVREVTDQADQQIRQSIDQIIVGAIGSQVDGSNNLLTRILRHIDSLEGAETIRAELAKRYKVDGEYLQLERLALGTTMISGEGLEALSNSRLLMLADAYSAGRMTEDLRTVIKAAESRNGDQLHQQFDVFKEVAEDSETADWAHTVSLTWDSRPSRTRSMIIPSQRVSKTTIQSGKHFEGWRLVSEGANPLALRGPLGQLRSIPLEGMTTRDDGDNEAIIGGGMMVVIRKNEMVGVDLYRLLSSDGDSVLWRRGLSGDSGPIATRRSEMTPFDDQVFRYYLTSSTAQAPEFSPGPIVGDQFLVLQGGDLMALDLLTSEPRWRNSNAPRKGAVLSDGTSVAVVSPTAGKVEFFDLLDGRQLSESPWEYGEIWAAVGTNVLCYREKAPPHADTPTIGAIPQRQFEIRVVNPFSREVILQCEAAGANRGPTDVPCAYGRIIEGRYMTLLESDGQAAIWDVAEGREIGRPKLPELPGLQGLHALILDDLFVLLPMRRVQRSTLPQTSQLHTKQGQSHQTIDGVYAISVNDGTVAWKKDDFKEPWGCTIHQPAATPILLLTRSHVVQKTTGSRLKTIDTLALDVRDGKVLSEDLDRQVLPQSNEIETRLTVQPEQQRVIVHIGGELLTYNFGDHAAEREDADTPR